MSDSGRLIVFAAPAGAGKTTVIRAVRVRNPEWKFSCSATTRPPRPGEVHGQDYFFLTRPEFMQRVDAGAFLEYEEVHGNMYGTLKAIVDEALRNKNTMVLDLDVKGASNIKRHYPDALTIFIKPPSMEVLKQRLSKRGTDSPEVIHKRLERVEMEMAYMDKFDCIIVNNEIEQAVADVLRCVESKWPLA